MRDGSLTPVEQVAELGSEQGAQDVLRAAAERLSAHARKNLRAGKCKTAAAMLWGKCIHIDTAIHKACITFRMLDDILEAFGAPCEPDREKC